MMSFPSKRTAALLSALLLSACAAPHAMRNETSQAVGGPVEVGILAFNDFHGNIEEPKAPISWPDGHGGFVQVPTGSAASLATALDTLRKDFRYSTTVSAGDMISASPLASSLFLDEPTIGVMNRIGLEFSAVGNHEFDRGIKELQRVQNGGCDKNTLREPCQLEQFAGANFRYLSASTYTADGKTLFPATGIKRFGEGANAVTIGFVGLTLRETPRLVSPGGVAGLTFGDEAEAINRAVPSLKAEGADAIVVLIHQGGAQADSRDPNGCSGFSGDIQPILDKLDARVDVVISGHTHQAYICSIPRTGAHPLLLTSAGNYGRMVTELRLQVDPARNAVTELSATNVAVQSEPYTTSKGPVANTDFVTRFAPRADIAAYVQRYVDAASAFSQRTVGHLAGAASRSWGSGDSSRTGGSLGLLVADSQLAATQSAGAEIAFTNTGSLRADLEPGVDHTITFGQIYTVAPFGNTLVTMDLTGARIKALIEGGLSAGSPSLLIPSTGFAYAIDMSHPSGERVHAMTLDGKPVDPARTYRVTTNSFLSQGGDGFTVFTEGTRPVMGGLDVEALEAWLSAVPLRDVPRQQRVTVTGK